MNGSDLLTSRVEICAIVAGLVLGGLRCVTVEMGEEEDLDQHEAGGGGLSLRGRGSGLKSGTVLIGALDRGVDSIVIG